MHPGPVFVVIKSGALSVWSEDCQKAVHGVGSTFFEMRPEASRLVEDEDP